jgi:hypothetical protein
MNSEEKSRALEDLRTASSLFIELTLDLDFENDAEIDDGITDAVAEICYYTGSLPAALQKLGDLCLSSGLDVLMNEVPECSERLGRAQSRILTEAADQLGALEEEFNRDVEAALKERETRMKRGEFAAPGTDI